MYTRERLEGALQLDGGVRGPGLLQLQGDGENSPQCDMAIERAEYGLQQRGYH